MPHSPRSKPDANGPLTGGPFACVLAIHRHGGDHGIATRCLISGARQRMGRAERYFNVDDRAVRIRKIERDPATGSFEPDPPGCHSEMARAETSITVGVATRVSSESSLAWVLRCRWRCTPVGDIYLARPAADTEERYPGTPLPR